MPPWFGPPDNVLGQLVASQRSLAINAHVAIAIEGFTVYPTGVAFRLVAITNGGQWMGDPFFDRRPSQSGSGATLQFGIELADGRKTTVNSAILSGLPENEPPPAPVLTCAGGGGGGRRWAQELWLWPLPPPGVLALVVEWPAMGVSETRVEVDAGPFQQAAQHALMLWDEERPPAPDNSAVWAVTVGQDPRYVSPFLVPRAPPSPPDPDPEEPGSVG